MTCRKMPNFESESSCQYIPCNFSKQHIKHPNRLLSALCFYMWFMRVVCKLEFYVHRPKCCNLVG